MGKLGATCALVVAVGAATGIAARAAIDVTPRTILASGDVVAGFGRIGAADFHVQGIDRDGRVLAIADTSDGLSVLFWSDDDGTTRLWSASEDGGTPRRLASAATTSDGYVVASGTDGADRFSELTGLYEVRDGALLPLVRQGDLTPDGDRICFLLDEGFVVNDARTVAFGAFTVPADADCLPPFTLGVHRLAAGVIETLSRNDSMDPEALIPLGIAADGSVIANVGSRAVVALGEGPTRILVETGMSTATGLPLLALRGGATNPAGEVVFVGEEDDGNRQQAIYRTDQGQIVRVIGFGDSGPDGTTVSSVQLDAPLLADNGTVVVRATFVAPDRYTEHLVRQPAAGPPVYGAWAEGHAINAAGAVAVGDFRDPPDVVARWSDDRLEILTRGGDAAPNGSYFAVNGIEEALCLGADGRVAVGIVADSLSSGLACAGAAGFSTIARAGDAAPDGGTLDRFQSCGLPGDGSVLFGAARANVDDVGVYRATAAGLTTVAAIGSFTREGLVADLQPVNAAADAFFAFNQRGTVLVRAVVGSEAALLRRRPGGTLERVRFALDVGGEVAGVGPAALAADDTVIALARSAADVDTLVASDGARATVLASTADTTLPGGPFLYFSRLRVAGDRIVFTATAASSERLLTTSPAGGVQPLDEIADPYTLLDLSPARLLVHEQIENGWAQYVVTADERRLVGTLRSGADLQARAVNDRDNVLYSASLSPLGTRRRVLALSGPPADAADCFSIAPLTPTASPSASPTATPSASPSASPTAVASATATAPASPTAPPTATRPAATLTPTPRPTAASDSDDGCQISARPRAGGGAAWLLAAAVLLWRRGARRREGRR